MSAAPETFSLVLTIVYKSFRSVARLVLSGRNRRKPGALVLGVALLLAGCGGGHPGTSPSYKRVTGPGYAFRVPDGWVVSRDGAVVRARQGDAVVSVTTFPLARPYSPTLWPKVVPELDRVAGELAARQHGKLASSSTDTVASRKARVYTISRPGKPDETVAFVLDGRTEYQLFCREQSESVIRVCDELVRSFSLA